MELDARLKETQDKIWKSSDTLLEKVRKVYNLFDERLLNAETNGLPRKKYREIMFLRDLWMNVELNEPHVKEDPDTTVVTGSTTDIICKKNLIVLGLDSIPEDFLNVISITNLQHLVLLEGITSIAEFAFKECVNLKTVILPKGLVTIGFHVFMGCKSLENINLPTGFRTIGYGAFRGCSSLENITLPEGLTTIGPYAFSGCISLKNIEIPRGVNDISTGTFEGCTSLIKVKLHEGVTTIGSSTFWDCTSLKIINLPEELIEIGSHAFLGCTSLENITLPEGLTTIGPLAFMWCTSLKNITLPNALTKIGKQAFANCISFENIEIPRGVDWIRSNTFEGCTSLKKVRLPQGLITIGNKAFEGCTSLNDITIPNSVREIGKRVFFNCPNVKIKVDLDVKSEDWVEHLRIPFVWLRILELFPRMPSNQQEQILVNTVDTLQVRSFVKLNEYDKALVEEGLWGTSLWTVEGTPLLTDDSDLFTDSVKKITLEVLYDEDTGEKWHIQIVINNADLTVQEIFWEGPISDPPSKTGRILRFSTIASMKKEVKRLLLEAKRDKYYISPS